MSGQVQEFDIPIVFDFQAIAEFQKFADCTVTIGGVEFKSHRVLLAGCSNVLAEKFSDGTVTAVEFSGLDADSFRIFYNFLYSGKLFLSQATLPGLLKIAYELDIKSLFNTCSEFIDQISSARTVIRLLQQVAFALDKLPNFVKFCAALIEALQNDTDFAFLTVDEFKILISRCRFTSTYVRDDIIRKYLAATGADPEKFAEFAQAMAGAMDDNIQRTAYSAVFMCSPPDPGLLRAMASEVRVTSSEMVNGRDPSSLIEENPTQHWFTESDGNAWVVVEFTELHIQPTDYAIWSHGGASTLRNWAFQGSNDRTNWVVLSNHRNDESIRAPFSTATWPINTNGFFKYFRIIQTGNNWSGNRWLYMMKIDIWGVACQMDN